MESKSDKTDQNNTKQPEKSSSILKPSPLADNSSSSYKSVTTAEKVFAGAGGSSRGMMCNNLTSNPFSILATEESSSLISQPSIVAKPRFNFKPSALGSGREAGASDSVPKPAAVGYTAPKPGTNTTSLFGGNQSEITLNPFLKPAKLIHESDDSDRKTGSDDKKENAALKPTAVEAKPADDTSATENLEAKNTKKSDTPSTETQSSSDGKPSNGRSENVSLASSISTTIGQNTLAGTSAPTQSSSASFVFGEAVDARVTNVNTEVTTNGSANAKHAEEKPKTLEEAADEYKKQQESGPRLPEVEVRTGEENESNVLQINCKLFLFHQTDSSWVEKGRGLLRLNDCLETGSSRIIMRTVGTYQLILNTNIWFRMICDRASPKSLRITAMEGETVHVFLITGSQSDIDHLYNSISYRISSLKQKSKQESSDTTNEEQEGDKSKTLKRTAPDQQQSTSPTKKTKVEGDSINTST